MLQSRLQTAAGHTYVPIHVGQTFPIGAQAGRAPAKHPSTTSIKDKLFRGTGYTTLRQVEQRSPAGSFFLVNCMFSQHLRKNLRSSWCLPLCGRHWDHVRLSGSFAKHVLAECPVHWIRLPRPSTQIPQTFRNVYLVYLGATRACSACHARPRSPYGDASLCRRYSKRKATCTPPLPRKWMNSKAMRGT